jgi:integrase
VRLQERAELIKAAEPSHYVFPGCEALKIDPPRPQKSWRTAWRSLTREAARIAGRSAAREAIHLGRGFKAGLKAWRKAAEPFQGFRFHDLRHHAITELAESGASDATLMGMAGHMSRRMMAHYSHTRMEAKRAAVAA